MPLDAYSSCPGGSGKKIKHCDCRDIIGDLEHITRSLEGGQRVSALDRINRLLATHANRPCLLSMKAATQMALQEMQGFEETVAAFVQVAPRNPLALAYSAISKLLRGDADGAVDELQSALARVDREIPRELYEAIGAVGRGLLDSGKYVAARAHYLMQMAMSGNNDNRLLQTIVQLSTPEEIPALLKQDRPFPLCPVDVAWVSEYEAALETAIRGHWSGAIQQMQSLLGRAPGEPAILKSLAFLYSYLGKTDEAVAHWNAYAASDGISLQDQVEAKAMADLLSPAGSQDMVDVVQLTYPVSNTATLMEKLLTDKRMSSVNTDLSQFASEDEPPPKGVFWLLDRPLPISGQEVQADTVPRVRGDVFVHGKQTDRDARLVLNITKDDRFEADVSALREVVGDSIGELSGEKVVGNVPREASAIGSKAVFPDDTPTDIRRQVMLADRERAVFEYWPKTHMVALDGRSPEEAKDDPQAHATLLALLLNLEQKCHGSRWEIDLNPLRARLGLPQREPIDPTGIDVGELPLVDLSLVMVEKLADDQLKQLYEMASMFGQNAARRRLAGELVGRESIGDEIDKAAVYGELADLAVGFDEALAYLAKAQETALAAGESPAMWLIAELRIRLLRQDAAEAQDLLNRIRARHMNEPGVSQALFELLVQFGILTPQGQPTAAAAAAGQPAVTGAEPSSAGKIWTPGGDSQTSPSKQSKLYIPD